MARAAKCPAGWPSPWVNVLCVGDSASLLVEKRPATSLVAASGLANPGLKCSSVLVPAMGRPPAPPQTAGQVRYGPEVGSLFQS